MVQETHSPKYPDITVDLTQVDGNAFSILGACRRAARSGGVPSAQIEQFVEEAMSGEYDHLLQTCFRWFDTSKATGPASARSEHWTNDTGD